jgi:hypothetical protein
MGAGVLIGNISSCIILFFLNRKNALDVRLQLNLTDPLIRQFFYSSAADNAGYNNQRS